MDVVIKIMLWSCWFAHELSSDSHIAGTSQTWQQICVFVVRGSLSHIHNFLLGTRNVERERERERATLWHITMWDCGPYFYENQPFGMNTHSSRRSLTSLHRPLCQVTAYWVIYTSWSQAQYIDSIVVKMNAQIHQLNWLLQLFHMLQATSRISPDCNINYCNFFPS
jgi:hypothetical protein